MKALLLLRIVAVVYLAGLVAACTGSGLIQGDNRYMTPLSSQTVAALRNMGSSPAAPMMIRIYKEESELEVWKQVGDGSYKHFKDYTICDYSGVLGPKIKEGDRQSPEGFYTITPGLMNPRSNYYLAFNLGFPNKFDRALGRTGSNLMVHGDCSSRGCYAMTDEQIAEIYALGRESFKGGNRSFQVQIYPFRLTPANFARHHDNENMSFWRNIEQGYMYTEINHQPPDWDTCGGKYVFNANAASGQPLDGRAACPALEGDASVQAQVAQRQQSQISDYDVLVADIEASEQRRLAEAERRAAEEAAMHERSEAINQTVNNAVTGFGESVGGFFSGLFGGAPGQPIPVAQPEAGADAVAADVVAPADSAPQPPETAPIPAPPIRG